MLSLIVAATYFPLASIIGTTALNCCVRNENRCDPSDEALAQNIRYLAKHPKVWPYPRIGRVNAGRRSAWTPHLQYRWLAAPLQSYGRRFPAKENGRPPSHFRMPCM